VENSLKIHFIMANKDEAGKKAKRTVRDAKSKIRKKQQESKTDTKTKQEKIQKWLKD